MRTFETKIQELKTAVLTEVARLTWEDRLQTGTAILDIPEKIIPRAHGHAALLYL